MLVDIKSVKGVNIPVAVAVASETALERADEAALEAAPAP